MEHLHTAHMGYDSMVRRARDSIFWLGMPADTKQLVNNCSICQQTQPSNTGDTLLFHNERSQVHNEPFAKVGVDIFEYDRKHYLVTVDYFSNFAEIDVLPSLTAKQVIITLKSHCAHYGISKCVVSDFETQFTSNEFRLFCGRWSISHYMSSPTHQQCNDKAEAHVKFFKHMLQCTFATHQDQWIELLKLCNTPRQDINSSSAQVLFGSLTRSVIPVCIPKCNNFNHARHHDRRNAVKHAHDKHARPLPPLQIQQRVLF